MFWKLLILMFICHVIDDFVLQPICLSKLKQKDWWFDNVFIDDDGNYDFKKQEFYKNDYKIALLIHSLSWSAMILLPLLFLTPTAGISVFCIWIANAMIHYITDDLKANEKKITLVQDQIVHFVQIFLTLFILYIIF